MDKNRAKKTQKNLKKQYKLRTQKNQTKIKKFEKI